MTPPLQQGHAELKVIERTLESIERNLLNWVTERTNEHFGLQLGRLSRSVNSIAETGFEPTAALLNNASLNVRFIGETQDQVDLRRV